MTKKKNEIRTTSHGLHIVQREGGQAGGVTDSRTIEGYAIVFNEKSQVLDDWDGTFREVIDPSSCTSEFLATQDVKMTLFHEREMLIARCNKGEGSMTLEVDDRGVKFRFDAPKTDCGDMCLEGVKRGDLSGCSFTFLPDWDSVERGVDEETGLPLLRHKRFKWLGEMTIGSDPAYLQTTVNAREMFAKKEQKEDKADEELRQRETSLLIECMKRETELQQITINTIQKP